LYLFEFAVFFIEYTPREYRNPQVIFARILECIIFQTLPPLGSCSAAGVVTDNQAFNSWLMRSFSDVHLLSSTVGDGLYPYAGVPWFSCPFGRDGLITARQMLMVEPRLGRGVLGYRADTQATSNDPSHDEEPGKILHESLTDGGQMLLLGAMLIGILSGAAGQAAMKPFTGDLFKGMLAFFLLDMGLLAARNMGKLKGQSPWLLLYAVGGPLVHAALALGLSLVLRLEPGNAALLMVLAASASYIAVPAVIRHAIPEANPSLYFGLSLGLTFPFTILIGIPLYVSVAHAVMR